MNKDNWLYKMASDNKQLQILDEKGEDITDEERDLFNQNPDGTYGESMDSILEDLEDSLAGNHKHLKELPKFISYSKGLMNKGYKYGVSHDRIGNWLLLVSTDGYKFLFAGNLDSSDDTANYFL